ncbi:hypothetical protein [Candidatus Nephthysia bennettiae]|uniref:Uncharacterized protein n=1 Tax=Candidatus Nephthysia bennettiae TaxID=3127016 RepID=A0A934K4U5_9BACT|nr:hypothetical protein [Candidatus Dormibacteraeota bacterium]MBJ7614952.1 hypothetical protein [Candidatus Dormibacteraeota bacterium]
MLLHRLRWAASQLGARGGGRLLDPAVVLLRLSDMPGGWRRIDERRWRTGRSGGREPWAVRAREMGGVTAWRSFAAVPDGLWLWAQATPLASQADAASAIDGIWGRSLRNLRARVEVVASQEGPRLQFPDGPSATLEQQTRNAGREGMARYVAWTCRGVLSVVAGSGTGSAWSWPDLQSLASVQSERIRAMQERA